MKLESEPISDVVIPLRSSDLSEGTADTRALEFTPDDWATPQTVTVTGVNDGEEDASRRYAIVLERAKGRDRFYDGFDSDDVFLTNRDNDPEEPSPSPGEAEQDGKSGVCAFASGAKVRNTPKSGVLNLFLVALILLSVFPWRSLLKEG